MFSRAGCDDYVVIALAFAGKFTPAQLVCFHRSRELAWFFPRYDCFRWTWSVPSQIYPAAAPLVFERPKSRLA